MDAELQPMVSEATTSRSSETLDVNDGSPLLSSARSDQAKRLKDESLTVLRDKYPKLGDVNAIHVLKVVGSMNYFMRDAQREITELCISIAYPLVILQCRSLINLLSSLSALDDHGGVASNYLDAKYSSVLTRLEEYFEWRLEFVWNKVFSHWRNEPKDGDLLDTKTSDLRYSLNQISPIVISVQEAFREIDKVTGTTLIDITRGAEETFNMFEAGILKCVVKADVLRADQERKKHLSPLVDTSRPQSWASGASPPSNGIVQRTSFGRGRTDAEEPAEPDTSKNPERRRTGRQKRMHVSPDRAEGHWTRLFNLGRSPVVLIFITAMPLAVYSTIICEMPDALPAFDSNFYSTLSQCVSSFAGLYVIVKPILSSSGGDGIKTSFPKVFYAMLTMSSLTSIASAVAYAWSPPASIPLAYVSGLTLNIATLLIIQDSAFLPCKFTGGWKLKFDAAMSPKSFILTPDCHQTGGAALYNWFYALQADASMTGSYMITIGGYQQAFTTTAGFPEPSQLHIS
ncbi:hypothetical protein DER45DRAFT_545004 [Fusarium avenaceum]|nr:hypothetical protein DER45DRAFT_545004 [Fusarium avenaceum]